MAYGCVDLASLASQATRNLEKLGVAWLARLRLAETYGNGKGRRN